MKSQGARIWFRVNQRVLPEPVIAAGVIHGSTRAVAL